MSDEPIKSESIGARDALGRWAVGNPGGPGRPKVINFRALVINSRGETVNEKFLELFDALMERARGGDVAAAKLLLDKLCENDATKLGLEESFDAILRKALGLPSTNGVSDGV